MQRNFSLSETGKYWLWSLFYAMLFLFIYGYKFNCSDLEEHLPLVYKLHHPNLYQGDYVTDLLYHQFSIRYYYAYTVYALSLWTSVATTVFVLMMLLLSVFNFYLIKTAAIIFKSPFTGLLTPLISLIVLNTITVGGNNVSDNMLTCSVFANALSMAAFYYAFAGRMRIAMIGCGAATLFQPLIGLQVFLLIAILYLLSKNLKFKTFGVLVLIYVISSMAMLAPLLKRQFAPDVPSDMLYYYVLYVFRNPHHYYPTFFPATDYLKVVLLLALGTILFIRLPSNFSKQIFILSCTIIGGMMAYYLVFERAGIMSLGKLQWFKTSVWLTVFIGMYIAHGLLRIKLIRKLTQFPFMLSIPIAGSVVLFYLITHATAIPISKLQGRYQIGQFKKTDLTIMHEWIRENTDEQLKIISFPEDDSFLCEAQRPAPVAWKAIIHEPGFLNQWYLNFTELYAMPRNIAWINSKQLNEAAASFALNTNEKILKQHATHYRLDFKPKFKIKDEQVVHRQGEYVFWKID